MLLYWLAALSVFIFLFSFLQDRRKLRNGFFFTNAAFFCTTAFVYFALNTQYKWALFLVGIAGFVFIVISIFGLFGLMIAAFLNARIVIKKEGKRLPNLLTLFVGILLLIFLIYPLLNLDGKVPAFWNYIYTFLSLTAFYLAFNFVNFIFSLILYQFYRPKLHQDFIIVLGSGLINGHIVPPLLQSRINQALAFYHKQAAVTTPPTIVFSGGQGPDELLPEAHAMQKYAFTQGLLPEHSLVEDQSVNTYQNMVFSKRIIDAIQPTYHALFSTNNYHLFRAGIYARMAGLEAQGIGAKTAFYYIPNAVIREFIAIINMHRKWHALMIGFIAFLILAVALLQYWLG